MCKQSHICREKKPMPITLNSTLDGRTRGESRAVCIAQPCLPCALYCRQAEFSAAMTSARRRTDRTFRALYLHGTGTSLAQTVYTRVSCSGKKPSLSQNSARLALVRYVFIWQNRTVSTCQLSVQP